MGMRSLRKGVFQWLELLANVSMIGGGVILSLALGVFVGIVTYLSVARGNWEDFTLLLHLGLLGCLLAGILLPFLIVLGNPSFDARHFLLFPISLRRLFGVGLAASIVGPGHVSYIPALFALFLCGFLLQGVGILQAFFIILLFFISNVAWSHTATTLFQVALRSRRFRELAGLIFLSLLLVWWFWQVTVIPQWEKSGEPDMAPYRELFFRINGFLPSGVAANGLLGLHRGEMAPVLTGVLVLLVLSAAGLVAGYGAFRLQCFHVGRPASTARDTGKGRFQFLSLGRLDALPFQDRETLAVVIKDLRYIFRSAVGKYNFIAVPLLIVGLGLLFRADVKSVILGLQAENILFPVIILYTSIFTNNIVLNAFAWESGGIQAYFLSPVPLRKILLGKNIAFWAYTAVLSVTAVAAYAIFVGSPGFVLLISGLLLFAILMVVFAMGGNLCSILHPVRRDMSAVWKNNTPGMGILVMMVTIGGVFPVYLVLALLSAFVKIPVLLPLGLFALLGVLVGLYGMILKHTAALMENRKEKLMGTLQEKLV